MSATNPYPSYLEAPSALPAAAWHAARVLALACTAGVIALLFASPHAGLVLWWLVILPCLPLVFMFVPGLWRNLCPMATLNQVPRLFGFTRGATAPGWLLRNAILVQAVFYFALITTRVPYLDHNGPATGALMIVALAAAFAGGVAFKGKSGWCGTLCPLMPIQRLYGQTPAVVVPNSHCATCVGCTPNCLDFNPRLAVIADVRESDAYRVDQLKIFAGVFPGFVVAFLTVPSSLVGEPASLGVSVGRYYLLTAVYMLVSLGIFYLLDALLPLSPLVLMAVFAAAALNLHNLLRFGTAFNVSKPTWLRILEGLLVLAATATFVVRTWRHERRVDALERAEVQVVPRLDALRSVDAASPEVAFAPEGPRIVVPAETTVLEAAERAGLHVEAGCRMGVCGSDPIAIVHGLDRLSPPAAGERATLERLGLGAGCRMACSARVRGRVEVSFDVATHARPVPASGLEADPSISHVVIVGNGIAANTAADHVRRRHPTCSIDLIGDELHPLYNRMGISRLVYGRSAMAGLVLHDEDWYDRNSITPWLNTVVDEIDRPSQEVQLATGERLPYDRLILATGAVAWLPPLPGIDDPAVFVMRNADDAIRIRSLAQRAHARRAVVVGGGLLGLEAASSLHRLGLRTAVVQRAPRLLDGQLDERAAALLEQYFRNLGIGVTVGTSPLAIVRGPEGARVGLQDGTELPADLVVICAGIRPAAELAGRCGLLVDRGVIVDSRMQTSDPLIYAAGDVAQHEGEMPGLWPVAVAQAEVAAANALGEERVYEPRPPVAVLKGVGLTVMSAGDVEGLAAERISRESTDDDCRYWTLVVRDGVAAGAVVIGDWPHGALLVDAVVARRHVAPLVPALQAGDLSVLAIDEPEPVATGGT